MKKHYVYSTLSSDVTYNKKDKHGNIEATVTVAGKANIPNRHMLTSKGITTEVSEAELDLLNANRVFQLHKKNGFITVEDKKHDAEKVADSMNNMDKSAPLTAEQLAAEGKNAPKTNKRAK